MLHTKPHVYPIFWNKCFSKRSTVCTWTFGPPHMYVVGVSDKSPSWILFLLLQSSVFLLHMLSFLLFSSPHWGQRNTVCGWWHHAGAYKTETSVRIQGFGFRVGTPTHTRSRVQPSGNGKSIISFSSVTEWEPHPLWQTHTHTHTHLLFFCFSLSFSHVHFMPAGRKRFYMMPITTPGWASHVSVSTSIP